LVARREVAGGRGRLAVRRQALIRQVDEQGSSPPANSSINELVIEAAYVHPAMALKSDHERLNSHVEAAPMQLMGS
jgi:hypothetical protein